MVEDKVRSAAVFYLTEALWRKLLREARTVYKMPVYRVTVGDAAPVAVIQRNDWLELGGEEPKGACLSIPNKSSGWSCKISTDLVDDLYDGPLHTQWLGWELIIVLWDEFEKHNDDYMEELCQKP